MKMNEKQPYITTYESISGWKAVCIWWNPDGFWEPWQTGQQGYATESEAEVEAEAWADIEGLECVKRGEK